MAVLETGFPFAVKRSVSPEQDTGLTCAGELLCMSQSSAWMSSGHLSVFQEPKEQPRGAQLFGVK